MTVLHRPAPWDAAEEQAGTRARAEAAAENEYSLRAKAEAEYADIDGLRQLSLTKDQVEVLTSLVYLKLAQARWQARDRVGSREGCRDP